MQTVSIPSIRHVPGRPGFALSCSRKSRGKAKILAVGVMSKGRICPTGTIAVLSYFPSLLQAEALGSLECNCWGRQASPPPLRDESESWGQLHAKPGALETFTDNSMTPFLSKNSQTRTGQLDKESISNPRQLCALLKPRVRSGKKGLQSSRHL